MRQRRILAVLAIAGGLCAPRDAAANCQALGPFLGTGLQLPLGCPLYVYTFSAPGFDRRVTVLRGGAYVDATGMIDVAVVELQVERTFLDCQLQPTNVFRGAEPYERFAIQPAGVQVGERIGVGQGWFGGIEIVPAGPCAAPIEPAPKCTTMPTCNVEPPFESFGPGSCSAQGGGGLLGGLALVGLAPLVRARRRRRR